MISELLKQTIITFRPSLKVSPSGWSTDNCPMCTSRGFSEDTRNRLGLKFGMDDSIGMNCFNCAFKTRWKPGDVIGRDLIAFLSAIGVSDSDIKEIKFAAYRNREPDEHSIITIKKKVTSEWVETTLPPNSYSLTTWAENGCDDKDFIDVVNYAIQRKLTDFDNLYWTPDQHTMFNRRLILPYTYDNIIVGYSARICGTPPKHIPKYMSSTPPSFIYNLDAQFNHRRKYCIITEGQIDACLLSGISCFGNTINQNQIDLINSLRKTVIVSPDRDDSGDNLVKLATQEGWFVSFPKWDVHIKDAADAVVQYGRLLTLQSIIESKQEYSLKIHVSRKLDNYED
jgi:hypothetical protein